MEEGFSGGKNRKGSIEITKVRGAIQYLAEKYNIDYIYYAPKSIKKEIAKHGGSDKDEIYISLCKIYGDDKIFQSIKETYKKTDDIYDSIAIALMPDDLEKN